MNKLTNWQSSGKTTILSAKDNEFEQEYIPVNPQSEEKPADGGVLRQVDGKYLTKVFKGDHVQEETFNSEGDAIKHLQSFDLEADYSDAGSIFDSKDKTSIKSARGELTDTTRELVRDILSQVPSLVKVPTDPRGIQKEIFGSDHVCYSYTEAGPRKGSTVTVEFHVDPTDLYTDVYISTQASFAAAADGEEAHQDDRPVALDKLTIEDLEDYSLAEIDRINNAVDRAFFGAENYQFFIVFVV